MSCIFVNLINKKVLLILFFIRLASELKKNTVPVGLGTNLLPIHSLVRALMPELGAHSLPKVPRLSCTEIMLLSSLLILLNIWMCTSNSTVFAVRVLTHFTQVKLFLKY